MIILFVGDVVSTAGCEFLRKKLPEIKKKYNVDFCIVNGENSAQGNGILPQSANHIFTSGADLITTGNHVLRRNEIHSMLEEEHTPVLRPQNMHRTVPGKGVYISEKKGMRLGVANIMGSVYMDSVSNPFDCADSILEFFRKENVKNILIDFHAEATAEKRAMGFYLDSKVSAVLGTHTHVQTADEQILPGGTAYISDAGMTGVTHSVLGVKIECATQKLRTGMPVKFENPEGECSMGCVIVETDNKTGRAVRIERLFIS